MGFNFILIDSETTVDMSMLKELAEDDPVIIKPLIELFLTNVPESIEKMNLYYELKDWANVYTMAHFIKSTLSVIKIGKVYEALVDIELKAKNQIELDSIKPIINYIELQYGIAERLLKKELLKIGGT
jgi:HPt (histidine-containing phosphotransfer) domain-containing protein